MPELTAEQKRNIRTALRVAKQKGASPREQKALIEAMSVESGFRDLNYGDRDSLGILQQRNNGAWGAAKESVATDVGQFLDAARRENAKGKYGNAGDLAQAVQVSGFPDRYRQHSGEADQILASYGQAAAPASRKVRAPAATTQTTTTPGVDNSAMRRQLVGQFLAQGGIRNSSAVLGLAAQYGQAADVPGVTTTQKVRAPKQGSTSTGTSASAKVKMPTGTATFEGHTVAAWIKPALAYARKHGWEGTVNSGYRSFEDQTRIYNSGVRPAAKPGTSNHEGADYPRGAVDVSDPETLSRILAKSPYAKKLQWAGAKDPVHFSHPHGGSY